MAKSSKPQIVGPSEQPMTSAMFGHYARGVALYHGERILAEIPTVIRRAGIFLLVLSVTIPVFLAALLVVLWHFAG